VWPTIHAWATPWKNAVGSHYFVGQVKALDWFWLIDETLVLTSMLSV
jgi:hypothetical protein